MHYIFRNEQQETRKRARDSNDQGEDIFLSLLEEPMEVDKNLSLVEDKAFDLKAILSIGSSYSLLNSCLLEDMLIAFSVPHCSSCCVLMVWKSTDTTHLEFEANPTAVLSHTNKYSKSKETCNTQPPFLIAGYGVESISDSTTPLDIDLFTYLFGPENSLSRSLVVLYGCHCGSVFGCSLKNVPGVSHKKTVQNVSNQELVYCLEQPVLSIHSFYLYSSSKAQINAHNNLVLIGLLGKTILFTSHASQVNVHEIYVNGPLLSSILIDNYGLLLSSLDSVKKVCLKTKCLSNIEQLDDGDLKVDPSIFENAVTLIHSPHYLLATTADSSHLVMMSVDGCVLSVTLEVVSPFTSISLSPESVGKQLKDTLESIQTTSDTLSQVEQEIATVDTSLTALNEILTLFSHIECHSEPSPLNIEACIVFEHTDVTTRRPNLEVSIVYTGTRPLRKGCYLNIEVSPNRLGRSAAYVKPKMSAEDNSTTYTLVLSLEELQNGKELKLRPQVPPIFYLNCRLSVVCYLCYNPAIQVHSTVDTSEHKVAMIPVFTHSLTLLDFIEPQKSLKFTSTPKLNVDAIHTVTLTIRKTTLFDLYEQFIGSANSTTSLLSPALLACLLTTSKSRYTAMLPLVSEMSNHSDEDGVQLRSRNCDGSVIVFRLSQKKGLESASLTVSGSNLQCAVELTETIVQKIQVV